MSHDDILKLRTEVRLRNLDGIRQMAGISLLADATALFSGFFEDFFSLKVAIECCGFVLLGGCFLWATLKYFDLLKEIDSYKTPDPKGEKK